MGFIIVTLDVEKPGIEEIAARLEDMTPVFEAAAPQVKEAMVENIEKQDGGEAGQWAPLKPATVRQRLLQGFPAGPPLQKTGALKASIHESHDKTSAEAGPDVDYAAAQNAMRPFAHLPDAAADKIAEDAADFLIGEGT